MFRLFRMPWAGNENRNASRRLSPPRRSPPGARRLQLERLEQRALLATITVTTESDAASHTGVSLRDAIAIANAAAAAGVSDTIEFEATLEGATIALEQGQLELSGAGTGKITIDGSSLSGRLTVSGANASRVFQVDRGVQAEIDGIAIVNGAPTGPVPWGGGIYNQGFLTLSGDELSGNAHGCILNIGALNIASSTIQANAGDSSGAAGGITNLPGGQVVVSLSNLLDNSGFVGGIFNAGTATVSDTTLSGNQASAASPGGGGVFNQGEMTIWRSTIAQNRAAIQGGGILNLLRLSVIDSTLYGNAAAEGAGIFSGPSGAVQLTVNSSTIVANDASSENGTGGIFFSAGQFILLNSIVTDNRPLELNRSPDLSVNNIIGASADLGPLADNGGPTQTMALLAGSPAIGAAAGATYLTAPVNAAATTITLALGAAIARTPGSFLIEIDSEIMLVTNASGDTLTVVRGQSGTTATSHAVHAAVYLATDQRGLPRTVNGSTDIGAYQTQTNVNEIYVQSLYESILNRPADAGGLAYWSDLLGQGASRQSVSSALVTSDEYDADILITSAYQSLLLRAPDPTEIAFWLQELQSQAANANTLEATIAASPEFYQNRGGGTDSGWIDALYLALLGRPADAAGKAQWLQQLAEGVSRSEIAFNFVTSVERQQQLITDDYMRYLGRAPDEQGLAFWLGQLQQGLVNQDVIAALTASDEYALTH